MIIYSYKILFLGGAEEQDWKCEDQSGNYYNNPGKR